MTKRNLFQAAVYLLCAVLAIWSDQSGSEFAGGWLTGRLLNLHLAGWVLLVAATFLTMRLTRLAASLAITGLALCAPFELYFVAPGAFRSVFPGEYSVPLYSYFVWDARAAATLLAFVAVASMSLGILFTKKPREDLG